MKPKEKIIWDLAQVILNTHGDRVDSMDIIKTDEIDEVHIKIYHGKGHCFELKKQYICEPGEVEEGFDYPVWEDGYYYYFDVPWDGFTVIGIDKAIDLLKEYAE